MTTDLTLALRGWSSSTTGSNMERAAPQSQSPAAAAAAAAAAAGIAKWRAACGPCAAAKAKCLRSSNVPGTKCDRCQRLYKDCVGQVHRPRKKRQAKPSKTAQLEERLNGLVEILKASGELPSPGELGPDSTCIPSEEAGYAPIQPNKLTTPGPTSEPAAPSDSTLGTTTPQSPPGPASADPNWIPSTWHCYAPSACVCRPQFKGPPPPPLPDEELLRIYRAELCPTYPFVVVPPSATAAELASTRPFLMQAIRTVAHYRSLANMQHNSYHAIKYLSEHMLVRASRSLDLLLGIIVYLGWYHTHCLIHAQLNNAVHLAFALVADLGLNRSPQLAERTRLLIRNPVEPDARTLEERRAMLGVWYLSSILHIGFSRLESLTYSRYVQECVQVIESAREYESDGVLAAMVRVQRLTAEIHILQTGEANELGPAAPPSALPRASHAAYIAAFQAELDRLRASLPRGLRSNKTIESSLASAQLHLYEPPLLTAGLLQSLSLPLSVGGSMQGGGALGSLDVLYHANAALKRWFDTFLGMPVGACLTLPLSLSVHLIYAITMLSRWAKLTAPWLAGRTGNESDGNGGGVGVGGGTGGPSTTTTTRPSPQGDDGMMDRQPSSPNFSSAAAHVQGLPPTIAALNAHLSATPGLALDVPGVLEAMATRFEAVIVDLGQSAATAATTYQDDDGLAEGGGGGVVVVGGAEQCVGPGAPITSIWELGVRKIRITRAKLEKITEMAAAGIVSATITTAAAAPAATHQPTAAADGISAGAGRPTDVHLCPSSSIEMGVVVLDEEEARTQCRQCEQGRLLGACTANHAAGPPPPSHSPSVAGATPGGGGGGDDGRHHRCTPGVGVGVVGGGGLVMTATGSSSGPGALGNNNNNNNNGGGGGGLGMGFPNLAGPGFAPVLEMAHGVDWMRNSYWANSNEVFDGLDPSMWWDGSSGGEATGWTGSAMDTTDAPGGVL